MIWNLNEISNAAYPEYNIKLKDLELVNTKYTSAYGSVITQGN